MTRFIKWRRRRSPIAGWLLVTVCLTGCATPSRTVPYDPEIQSVTEFTRAVLIRLAAPGLPQPQTLSSHDDDQRERHTLDVTFWPAVSQAEVDASFAQYCAGQRGEYRDGLCTQDDERSALFAVQLEPTGQSTDDYTELRMIVDEALIPGGRAVLEAAQARGYRSRLEQLALEAKARAQGRPTAPPTPEPLSVPVDKP